MANDNAGVQIPVIIDIDKACADAAARVAKALQPLKQQVEANALKLRLQVDSGKKMNLGRILDDATLSSKQLQNALNDVEAKISKIAAKRKGFDFIGGITDKEKQLLQAYAILEKRITGIGSTSTVTARLIQTKLAQLRAELSKLEAKLKTIDPGTTKFRNVSSQILQTKNSIAQLASEYSRFAASTSQYNANMQAFNGTMLRQYGLWGQLTSAATMYVSVFGLIRFAKQVRDVTAELEFQRVALSHLIQDEEYGARLFEQIKGLAIESPFRIKDLVTYTKQLAAYRIETENLFDTTKRLADISAGLGVDMNRLILAYGQVRAASVLRGQELRQFTEAGIPLVDLLAEKFSVLRGEMVSTADVFKLISERAVPFSMISEIFEDMTEKGGMFYEMQKTQADTLKGKWEKLKDAYDIGLQTIGETATAQVEMDAILWILNRLAKNLQIIPKLLMAGTTAWVAWKVAVLAAGNATRVMATEEQRQIIAQKLNNVELSKSTLVKLAGANASRALTRAVIQETLATNGATRAWARLKIAFLTNPWGVAIAGITALVSALTFYQTKTDEIAEDTQRFQSVLDGTAKAMREFNMTGRLIDQYERLASKTERTASENNLLRNTMERLADAFPGVKLGIDSENDSLSEQVRLLKEARDIKNEEARRKAEDELNLQTVNLEKYQKDLDRLVKIRDGYNTELQRQQKLLADAQLKIDSGQLVGEDFAITKREISDRTREIEYYRKKLNELGEEYDTASENVTKTTKKVESLNRLLNPEVATKGWDAWKKELQSMQKIVVNMQEYTLPSVTDDDIQGYMSLHGALKKVEKAYKDSSSSAKEMSERLKDMSKANGVYSKEYMENLQKDYDLTQAQANGLKAILDAFGYILSGGNQSGSSYQKPKFITDMEEAIKFMKDFKKGYDDLRKYMGSEGALGKEAEIMLGRGLGLGIDAQEQKKAAENLSEWYQEMIDKTMAEMKKRGARGTTVTDLLGFDPGKNKALSDFQKLLQSLFDAKTDLDTSNWEKSIEKALSDLSEKVKRSEAAKKFYEDIFKATGSEEIATNFTVSIYGNVGDEFKDRIQMQLDKALSLIDDQDIPDFDIIKKAFDEQDFKTLYQYMSTFPKEVQKVLKEAAKSSEQFRSDWLKTLATTYQKTKTYDERIAAIREAAAKERGEVEADKDISPAQKQEYTAAINKKEAQDIVDVEIEALKNTYEWARAFEDLDKTSTTTLKSLISMLDEYIAKNAATMSPEQLKIVTQARQKAENTVYDRRPVEAIMGGAKQVKEARKARKEAKKQGKETKESEDALREGLYKINAGLAGMEKNLSAVGEALQTAMSAFGVDETSAAGGFINGMVEGFQQTAAMIEVCQAAMVVLNLITEANPIGAIVGAIATAIALFTAFLGMKAAKAEKKIKKQKELVEELEKSYDRLEKAIGKAFGSDYIYNYQKQLENLKAQQEAYTKMAELEQSKGKKKSSKKIKEYQDKATEAGEAIEDMAHQLSEFFTGTDLTSAAEDFATAWIDAYKEFSNTSGAITDEFNSMIQNMVTKSIGARIMQNILQPLFDQIDAMAKDGDLSAYEISEIARQAPKYVEDMNLAMTNMANELAAAGYNLRGSASGLTGISREIASASEESILGLSAAINTQNFYISRIPSIDEKMSQIITLMGGNVAQGGAPQAETPETDLKLQYLSYLPTMASDVNEILVNLKRVISPKGASTATHYIAMR